MKKYLIALVMIVMIMSCFFGKTLVMANEESDDTWSNFFDYLKERGLQGIELVISDAHKGLVSAIRKSFTNASWQ